MLTRKYILDLIEHNVINVRHLVLDDDFITSGYFNNEDIKIIINTLLTVILSHTQDLQDMEK